LDRILQSIRIIMDPEVRELLEQMHKLAPSRNVDLSQHASVHTYQTLYMARLLVLLAEQQEKASQKMEQQTDRLIQQTDSLVAFTKGLYWFTIAVLMLGVIQLITTCHHP
jgi:hypothetical protein